MARAAGGGRVLSPGVPGQGMNPFVIDRGDSEELLQRIGSLRRLIEVMVGERLSAERQVVQLGPRPGGLLRRAPRADRLPRFLFLPGRPKPRDIAHLMRPFATGSLRHLLSDEGDDLLTREALVTVFDLHLLEPELRPAAAMVCTETVWAAAAQDPRPRLLVVDEVWSDHAAPRGRGLHGEHGETSQEAPAGPPVHHPGRAGPPLRGFLPRHHWALRAGRFCRTPPSSCCSSRTRRPSAPWARPSTCPGNCNAGCLSCPRGDGLLLARGNRFPVRIEATPEETAVIEWRPGPQALER